MLRYIAWRLLFEICNVRRLFGHGHERVQYLAFGANLSDAVMNERRIRPFAMKPFTLRNHGLRFDHPAPWTGCAYASAEPADGESVHGFLYTLSARDAARMDFYEAVPVINRYRRTWAEQDGKRVYFYQTNRSTPDLRPTEEYLGYIVKGLESHPGASDEYRRWMAATPTAEPGKFESPLPLLADRDFHSYLNQGGDLCLSAIALGDCDYGVKISPFSDDSTLIR
jgi:hypothetical protein